MTISGNISSTEYTAKRAGLPANTINIQSVPIESDDAEWPCGLVLGRDETWTYLPYAEETVQIGTGDGAETDFTDEKGPIEPGSASVEAGVITLTDDGAGNLSGTGGSGSINYETGTVVVAFDAAPANAAAVNLIYKPDPVAVLDVETDTSKSDSGLVVRFGAVRKAELKMGVTAQTAASAAVIRRLDIHNIYAV